MMFAGSDSASASDIMNADFRVYEDGQFFATKANLRDGCIIGNTVGNGAFQVDANGISSSTTESGVTRSLLMNGSWLQYSETINSVLKNTITIGRLYDSYSDVLYENRIIIDRDGNSTPPNFGQNRAIYLDVQGSNCKNYAIYAKNGMYGGLRLDYDYKNAGFSISSEDPKNAYYIGAYIGVGLPTAPKKGQLYFFFVLNGVEIYGNGKNIATNGGQILTDISIATGAGPKFVIMLYTGNEWVATCFTSTI